MNEAARRAASLDSVADRVAALRRFVQLTSPYLPAERLEPAGRVIDRAGERLALSRSHTVVALAGATGSGKSSIFNALAGGELSRVGLRRPTTGETHAAVWGADDAHELLDWLGVDRRHGRADEPALSGLVLLDLPDFDSVEPAHRVEADRLLALADLMVWVLDPQKYADRVVHQQYLAGLRHHRDIMLVALNQADRLSRADIERCLADLTRILAADGLGGVPTLATSTLGDPGLAGLRGHLQHAVGARLAALQRLSADVTTVVAELSGLMVATGVAPVGRDTAAQLSASLAAAAGVPLVARAAQGAYIHRAVRHTGWPVTRWVRRLRADPLRRLRLGRAGTGIQAGDAAGPVPATSIGPAAPAANAAVSLALRAVGDRCAEGLAEPWPQAVLAATRSRRADIADSLDVAVARTELGLDQRPLWWRLVGALQLLLIGAATIGLAWLVVRYLLFALALPEPPMPDLGGVPWPTVLLVGGVLGGVALAAVARPVVGAAARRRRRRVTRALETEITRVGEALVLEPVETVRRDYALARDALDDAAGAAPSTASRGARTHPRGR